MKNSLDLGREVETHPLWTPSISGSRAPQGGEGAPRERGREGRDCQGWGPHAWGSRPHPPTPAACLSVTTMKGQLPQHEQPRSDATVNTQLARARPPQRDRCPTKKRNSKQQIRHNQHAATHTVQFFLQTRFNERIETGARIKQNRGGFTRAGWGESTAWRGCSAAGRRVE